MSIRSKTNIPRYFIYTVFKGLSFGLIMSMWLIYLTQRRGLSLTQATLVDVSFWLAAALGELPTGIIADTYGRKTALLLGATLMSISVVAWAFAETVPLIVITYAALSIGITFLSGADEAFFYETLQANGRADDYARLTGRAGAVMLGAIAISSVASGLLASIDLMLPFLVAGVMMFVMLLIILGFKETRVIDTSNPQPRQSYRDILSQSLAAMRANPALSKAMFYLTLVPLAAIFMETFFLQPQSLALGVPIAGIGVIVMAVQIVNMMGAAWSHRIQERFGDDRIITRAPLLIIVSIVLLALLQVFPALIFIGLISFVTSVLRPILMNRIQSEVPDRVRATILSMQSLMFTALITVSEPALGFATDHFGLPISYLGLASGLGLLLLVLIWKSRVRIAPVMLAPCTEGELITTGNC